jgi:hypothetical protein
LLSHQSFLQLFPKGIIMANFRAEKVLALPGTLTPNTIYLVADGVDADLMEVYVSSSDGGSARRVPTMADINTAIAGAISAPNGIIIVPDIQARNILDYSLPSKMVLVVDATGDGTVLAGAATYVNDGSNWIKIAEHESLDVTLEWASIQNGPTSSVAAIDLAVTNSHTHANKAVLDNLTFSEETGALLYNTAPVGTVFGTVAW